MIRHSALTLLSAVALNVFAPFSSAHETTVTNVQNFTPSNPFAKASSLPFQAPAFDKIKDGDFKPAIEEGMKRQLAEFTKIANNPKPATFENTLIALEKSGAMLTRASRIFFSLAAANTNPVLQKIQEDVAPKLAAHQDALYLNDAMFGRISTLFKKRATLKLDPESLRLVEYYYQQFIHQGANLKGKDKESLKTINKSLATLTAKFVNQLLDATKAGGLVIDNKADLEGMSDAEIKAASQSAEARNLKGKYVIPLQNTSQQPALQTLNNRSIREKLFKASINRTELSDKNDTRKAIQQIAQLRSKKASLLGFNSFADWNLSDQMAKSPKVVEKFIAKIVPATVAKMKHEANDIQAMITKTGGKFKLQPWDWNFYAEKVRKQKFDLDEDQVKPYFELNRVLKDGVFYAAHQLYGLDFKARPDLPVYQQDVKAYEVLDSDGSTIGLFYTDYFKRDNKSGGAWMDNLVGQSKLLGTKPVIYNVTNFTKPAPGQPALISYDDVSTMFHEFGHALHGLFADQQYPTLSGTNTARDFVEFPSQFNEHWSLYPEIFAHYAKHYKTGKPMPAQLVKKIKAAATFNQGYALTELLAAADLDMGWHAIPANDGLHDADRFEKEILGKVGLNLNKVPPRYRSSYFMHIWGNGYAAGYYAYLWTEMLDDDAYGWFKENGGLTRKNGDRFRRMILSRGNTLDYGKMFKAFRGRDPIIEPMLENRGLVN